MAYRGLLWVGCALGLAIACSGEPAKKVVMSGDAGAGGEAGERSTGSGGSSVVPHAGMPAVEAGAGGEAPLPGTAGVPSSAGMPSDAGAGGEPAVTPGGGGAGAGADQGGAPSGAGAGGEPAVTPGVSACGQGNYEDSEAGCLTCPGLPEPYYPTSLDCNNYSFASYDSITHTLHLNFVPFVREAFTGKVQVEWTDENLTTGSGQYDWSFDNDAQSIDIVVTDAPATAQAFTVTYLSVQDACGFSFYSASISVYWNVETWSCGVPDAPVSACGVGYYESGIDGCFSCPAPPDDPTTLVCSDFESANYTSYDHWLDVSFNWPIHEAFEGTAHIAWVDEDLQSGEGDYYWFFMPGQGFRFQVPDLPDVLQQIVITNWQPFTDACGFQFTVSTLPLVYDVDNGWETACGG